MEDLIQQLAEAWGPSGYEHHIRQIIRDLVEPYADEVRVDAVGNLICRVGSGGSKVMVAAHMDEIGVMPLFQEPTSGYLRFENIGGLLYTTLAGSRVEFEDGTIGVIGLHDQWGSGRTKAASLDDFYIDVSDDNDTDSGASKVGKPAKLHGPVYQRGPRLFGRAMDDRVGCAVAIETMRRLNKATDNEVYFVFTVQEELGLIGAQTSAFSVQPDVAIAVDVTGTGDQPHGFKMHLKLGEGTAIKVKDSGLVVPPAIRDWMVATAEANAIPYQLELLPMGATDAAAIQRSFSGVPSGVVSIPCRYVHTISETVDMRDVEASVALLGALVMANVPEAAR